MRNATESPLKRLTTMLAALTLVVTGSLVPATGAWALVDSSAPSVGWRPSGGTVYSIARAGDMVILGGTFTQMVSATGQTAPRSRLAAISASTGALLPWAPNPNGEVWSVVVSPDAQTVYAGGTFSTIGGASRTNVAAVSASTGSATAFSAPAPNATVRTLLLHDGGLFLGGTFWRVGTANRGMGAEVDPVTGALRPWNPQSNNGIFVITPAVDGSGLFIGGPLTTVGGQPRGFSAKVTRSSGALDPWVSGSTCQDATNPCHVYDMVADDEMLYLAVGGPGGRVTALDVTTGIQHWWVGGDGDFQTVFRDGNKLYAGGHFDTSVNGIPRAGLVALDRFTGAVLNELNTPVRGGTAVWDVIRDGDVLRFGGQYTSVGTVQVGRYSSFPILPDPADTLPPGAPGTPRAPAVLPDLVSLAWTASTDNVAPVQYRILRDGQLVGLSPVPLFKDVSVQPGTAYTYTVRAVDAAGNVSAASGGRSVTTAAATAYLLPRGAPWRFWSKGTDPGSTWTTASYDDSAWGLGTGEFGFGDGDENTYISPLGVVHYFRTSFDVADVSRVTSATFRLVVDDGAVIYLNGAEVARSNMPTGPVTNSTGAASSRGGDAEMAYSSVTVPVSRLVQGRNQLAVSVHNYNTGSSDVSFDGLISAVVQAGAVAPLPPTGLGATPTATAVALTWSPSLNATSYTVRRDGAVVGTTTAASFTDTGLQPTTEYTYTVSATNAAGASSPSAPLAVTTLPNPPPAPDGLSVTGTTGSTVSLSWNAAAGATSYVVERNGTALPAVTTTSFVDTGLAPSTSFAYRVRALNDGGGSPYSLPVAATTQAAPPKAPTGLTATATTRTAVTLDWDDTETATGYVVRRNDADVGTSSSSVFTDSGLTAATTYEYRVVAVNPEGEGPASLPLSVTTLPNPPDAPQGLTVTGSTGSSVSLTWSAVATADDYVVQRDGIDLTPVTGRTFTDVGLLSSTTYTYTVQARNAGGTSPASSPVQGATTAAPVAAYAVSGDVWSANDTGADLGTAWRAAGYDDSTWKSGPTQMGYGDGDEATVLTWGSNPNAKPITVYLRKTFDAGGSISDVTSLALRAVIDDGAVVYLNGQEIWRFNLPAGTITSTTRASTFIAGAGESQWRPATIPVSALQPGINTLAVEVHQDLPSSSDLSFNLELRPNR